MKKQNENKEEQKVSIFKIFRVNYKNNPPFKALVKLSLYFILFFVIILVVALSETPSRTTTTDKEKQESTEPVEQKTYKDILNETLVDNKVVKYEININDKIYFIEYTLDDNNFNGTIETSEGITKFTYKDNIVYEIILNEEIVNDGLFKELNFDYINIYSLLSIISSNKALKMINDEETIYNYELDNTKISVTVKDNKIIKIDIEEESNLYIIIL